MGEPKTEKLNLALQTWTVRHELRQNTEDVLDQIRTIGLRHLEVANTGRKSPGEFRRLCDQRNLTIIGSHEPSLTTGDVKDLLAEVQLRCNIFKSHYVTVMLDPEQCGDETAYLAYAKLCSEVGEALRRDNIRLCYHCYHYDLQPLKGARGKKSGLDLLLEKTSSDHLLFELDTYFIYKARATCEAVLDKCGPRCRLVHMCDINAQGNRETIGKGMIPWAKLIRAFRERCSPEWLIVEHDTRKPLSSVKESLSYLHVLLTSLTGC